VIQALRLSVLCAELPLLDLGAVGRSNMRRAVIRTCEAILRIFSDGLH